MAEPSCEAATGTIYGVKGLRVEIAKSQDGGQWEIVAKGTWEPGSDPVLQGESVPKAVVEDLVTIDTTGHESGTSYAQAGYIRYKMKFSYPE